MSWTLIFVLASIVFFNRYIFLEPKMPVKLPRILNESLKYSAPCLLIAICGPIILMEQGELREFTNNPYLWGALLTTIFAFFIRNLVVCVIISLIAFYILSAIL
ncbi:AzlD domain-containing protein [Xenorhabdus bovienii]|uniref:Branched-chain amino acid transport protein (AzlD) n=3 Tax=Xenorhabdus bovienii TaxID=40576 RepID=A0A0B6X4C4_XENBV|nr:AzlD domain-containing protein [Xenorhabdus bovienii]MCG3460709.1 AzlD domain-containing protein [Xenorhabdus bovienii]MCG3468886.1 AzlD domain-containing protein [Xenorhabdus bovienii]MDE9457767.1 AzlD domain-containing protein [Xenorhabdus bovienii]MDE9461301.1 AzlD domain-containing protein [Xenorhabdus bovienii]MDE9469606.1 AzlD domain-containing protein [Xenorhabdus bovienii]